MINRFKATTYELEMEKNRQGKGSFEMKTYCYTVL